jgi:hypothetical protein
MSATHSSSGARAVKSRSTRSGRGSGPVPELVVRGPLALVNSRNPAARISRSTLHRAAGWSSRSISAWSFLAPSTP